jgi:hypothetical protein
MMKKMTVFKLCAARDLTVVDGGLQFTASKNLQDKHKCNSENIAYLASLAVSSFYMNLLLKLSLSQSFSLQYSLPEYIVCEVVPPCCQHIPHKRSWKFCFTLCSMVGEIAATSSLMFCFKSTVFVFFSYTLHLHPEEEVTGVEMGRSCRPFIICFP